jgi:hypothetical protein
MPSRAHEIFIGLFGERLLAIGIIAFLIPLIMAFLPLYLKDSPNRWANIIVGIIFVFFGARALDEILRVGARV